MNALVVGGHEPVSEIDLRHQLSVCTAPYLQWDSVLVQV